MNSGQLSSRSQSIELGGDAKFGFALPQHFDDLVPAAAQKLELQPIELPLDLVEERDQQRQVDGMGERDPQRTDLAALERGRQRSRTGRGVITLLEQRMHTLTELGELGRPLAAEQVAAHLGFELLDRPRQRRLRHVAFIGRAREVERPRDARENNAPGAFPSIMLP